MDVSNYISLLRCFFSTGIFYRIVGFFLSTLSLVHAQQVVPVAGSYRTNLSAGVSGSWDDVLSWSVFDGVDWVPASQPPGSTNDVFVLREHELILNANEDVRNLYLFGQGASPGRKLNLQTFDLSIYGALHSLGEDAEGAWILHPNAHPTTDWIFPETGSLVFRGDSRVVVDRGSWSGLTNYSRFTVRFSPNPDATLVVNAAMKATEFIVESGTVLQTLNTNGTPSTSTFSFNIHDSFGTGAFGTLTIKSGARLISEASSPAGQILRRTATRPAGSFILEEGAELILLGERPQLEAEFLQLDGTVTYRYEGPLQQRLLVRTLTDIKEINTYHHLNFEGSGGKLSPENLRLSGNLLVSGGPVNGGNTSLTLFGPHDQRLDWPDLIVGDLAVDKVGGTVSLAQNITVARDFRMAGGNVDFEGHSLELNTSMLGSYEYTGGFWFQLNGLTLHNIPSELNSSTGTFPFFDGNLSSPRTVRLVGSSIPTNQTISIAFAQTPGTSLVTGLIDEDGAEIYYLLNSYFSVAHVGSHTGEMELWIQGDDMMLNDIKDLRIGGNGTVAVGNHLETVMEGDRLWAKRAVDFSDLSGGASFTLASTEPLSILPLEWRHFSALLQNGGDIRIAWQTNANEYTRFTLLRAFDAALDFKAVVEMEALEDAQEDGLFYFLDDMPTGSDGIVYYQVLAWEDGVLKSKSPVTAVRLRNTSDDPPVIFPNPYFSGEVGLRIPQRFIQRGMQVLLHDSRGKLRMDSELASYTDLRNFTSKLSGFEPGIYFINLVGAAEVYTLKWLKKY